jgi:lipoyl-dependent peroxiredoxin
MASESSATTVWEGSLEQGRGETTTASRILDRVEVTWPRRVERSDDTTSPEELLAAAHAACFSMALSGNLVRAGTPPDHLHVSAEVTFDKVGDGWSVTASRIDVVGVVPGSDEASFEAAAVATKDGCPISRALAGNVELSVSAALEDEHE